MVKMCLAHPNGFKFLEGNVADYAVGQPVNTGCYGSYVVNKIVHMGNLSRTVGFTFGIEAVSLETWELAQRDGALRSQKFRQKLLVAALVVTTIAIFVIAIVSNQKMALPLG